jgi:hypothetical protein
MNKRSVVMFLLFSSLFLILFLLVQRAPFLVRADVTALATLKMVRGDLVRLPRRGCPIGEEEEEEEEEEHETPNASSLTKEERRIASGC